MSESLVQIESRQAQARGRTIKGLLSSRPFRNGPDGELRASRSAVRAVLRQVVVDADDEREDPDDGAA